MQIDHEAERKELIKRYKQLIKACKRRLEKGDRDTIRKAFEVAQAKPPCGKGLGLNGPPRFRQDRKRWSTYALPPAGTSNPGVPFTAYAGWRLSADEPKTTKQLNSRKTTCISKR